MKDQILVINVVNLNWSAAQEAKWFVDKAQEGYVHVYADIDDPEENCTVVLSKVELPSVTRKVDKHTTEEAVDLSDYIQTDIQYEYVKR